MKIIAFIEDEEVIEKILKHLELWKMKADLPLKYKDTPYEDSTGLFRFSDFIP